MPEPVGANFPPRTDFASKAASAAQRGFAVLRELEALANDYVDLGYAKTLSADDLVGALDGLTPEQVGAAIQGVAALGAVLNADDGAHRKAFKVLAQFAR